MIRIAIPEPTSADHAYNARALPQYIQALQSAGAVPTVIPLHEQQARVARILEHTHGVLLPGSGFDIDPQAYGAVRHPACNPPDPPRAAVDELLLQDAFNLHKPILAICYGLQALNVWRNGTLVQDIPSEIPASSRSPIDHAPDRSVTEAHAVSLAPHSLLASLAGASDAQVNSSHHQALAHPGDNLRVTALSPADNIIEAVELDAPDHYVLGVQWHPERTYAASPLSRAIFASFVHAAATWRPRPIAESVAQPQL